MGPQPGNVRQQLDAGLVEIHPHAVDATDHHIVERLLEGRRVNVVLVLADADGLGVDLDQLRQGVHAVACRWTPRRAR